MLGTVKSGYGMVSISLLMLAVCAADAGREGETGTGAMWIAPELAREPTALTCAQSASVRPRDLVFETIEPGEVDEEEIRLLSMAGREVVSFEWNPATGELSYSTTAPTAVFSDL